MGSVDKNSILVVDDQAGIRILLEELFTDEGYEVKLAGNGNEALAKISEDNPDLILMDMKMPELNGLETLTELNKIGKANIVIMMTAYGELELISKAKELGSYDCIHKPFNITELCEMVATYFRKKKGAVK